MIKLKNIPEIAASGTAPFMQTIIATRDREEVGRAVWYAPADTELAQLLHIHVNAAHRRVGIGSDLLKAVYAQARHLSAARGKPVARFWCVLEHEHQIVARSFLFRHGYHHVGTVNRLFRGGQDAMVYVKAFD